MKLLITDKEIIEFLVYQINFLSFVKDVDYDSRNTAEAIQWSLERKDKLFKFKHKIKTKIRDAVAKDAREFLNKAEQIINFKRNELREKMSKNSDYFIEKIGTGKILYHYKKSKKTGFVKNIGQLLDPNSELIYRFDYKNYTENCLFRNMADNEEMLLTKIKENLPFWFIDTGYTNFINGKRKDWHRLTKNHLHHIKPFDAPVDRLGIFESFPKPWRTTGDKILIVEPGSFSAKVLGINIPDWKENVIEELKKHTEKKIIIREKQSKKIRNSLYEELSNDDYYCVININSNAAIEAIWSGIPVITLSDHISNPVSKRSLSDINNLYRGDLAKWLAMISYCQFTYEELINGKAAEIAKKYYV